jgi:hypothetical protein
MLRTKVEVRKLLNLGLIIKKNVALALLLSFRFQIILILTRFCSRYSAGLWRQILKLNVMFPMTLAQKEG